MPRGAMRRELLRVEEATNRALDEVLRERVPSFHTPPPQDSDDDPDGIRARMARGHRLRVDALLRELGREEGAKAGRQALFKAGMELGKEARARLGVGDGREDLERAARVLYKVLGIEISMSFEGNEGRMRVSRCSLSPHYSESTCAVLSAADEGMVHGLNPRAEMHFTESITSGKRECLAMIRLEEVRG